MATLSTTDFRKNLKILFNDEPWFILEAQHVKPGKGVAFVKTRMKNLITGRVLERNFRSGETLEDPGVEDREMQFLYSDGTNYIFMDTSNFEQVEIPVETLSDESPYLIEQMVTGILFWKARAINVSLPNHVVLEVTEASPGVKGDTATGGTKPVTVQTGASFNVPLYIKEGEKIKVDTRTGEFVERVNS